MNKENEPFISGVYNYCDRWCERCSFTMRCRIYQPKEPAFTPNTNNDEFWNAIHDSFGTALDLIRTKIEKNGEDWDTFYKEAMATEIKVRELTDSQKKLVAIAKKYYQTAQAWLRENHLLFQQKEDELKQQHVLGIDVEQPALSLIDATEVIQWYLFFIYVKIQRACKSTHDEWMQREYPIQNDANGTAKVAWVATQRTFVAWEVIRSNFPEQTDELLDIFILLDQIIKGLPKEFPNAHRFIRPGFDEQKVEDSLITN